MQKPNFLNDIEINFLISRVEKLLKDAKRDFEGKIFLLGPFPRFLVPCCPDPTHSFPSSEIFPNNLSYCNLFNGFLARHPALRLENVSFIHYEAIFGKDIPCLLTYDGVHLTWKNNSHFAKLLYKMIKRGNLKSPSVLPGNNLSFSTFRSFISIYAPIRPIIISFQ